MVSKNNRVEKMQQVAERQSHFGIRKLTIGAASVLLGTTLWLGTNANVTHAEDQDANGGGDADQAQKSESSASSIDSNTKVVVAPSNNQNTNANSLKSNISVANSKTDLRSQSSKNNANNNASSVKANISATKGNNASSVTESAPATESNKTTVNSNVNKAAQNSAQTVTGSLTKTPEEAKTVSDAQNQNAVKQTAKEVTQNSINQAANAGKATITPKKGLDLSKLDLSKAEQQAGLKTDPALKAQEKLANENADQNNEVTTLSINPSKDETIDAKQLGASLVGGAGLAGLDGKNSTQKINQVVIDKTKAETSANADSIKTADLLLSGLQGMKNPSEEAFDLFPNDKMPNIAPDYLGVSLAEQPGDSSDFQTVTDWQGVQDAVKDDKAEGVNISGNITAGNLTLSDGRKFVINGINGATLNFDKNVITLAKGNTLTLANITINSNNAGGAIVSNDDKNVINFNNVTDTKNSLFNGKGKVHIQGTVKTTIDNNSAVGSLDQQGIPDDAKTWSNSGYGATLQSANSALINDWKTAKSRRVPNIYASNLYIDDGATLDVERTADGDGIVLRDGVNAPASARRVFASFTNNGNINVGNNATLTINLKNSGLSGDDIKSQQQKNTISNLNAAIRVNNTGSFTSGTKAKITMNVGTGRGIVFSVPNQTTIVNNDGSNYVVRAAIGDGKNTDMWSSNDPEGYFSNPGFKNTFVLGDNTIFTFKGRDGIALGHDTTFNTGKNSNITINTYGCGDGLAMGDFSTLTVGDGSSLQFFSDGKTYTADSGWNTDNYIMLGEDGNISVKKNATLRVILKNRGYSCYNDNINIDSEHGHNPSIYVGNNATLDVQSDAWEGDDELISVPLASSASVKFIFDNVKYVNLQKMDYDNAYTGTGSQDGNGNLIYMDGGQSSNVDADKYGITGTGNYVVFKWNDGTQPGAKFTDGTAVSNPGPVWDDTKSVADNIKAMAASADQTWTNINSFKMPFNKYGGGAEYNKSSVSFKGDQSKLLSNHGADFRDMRNGFYPTYSQRLVIISTNDATRPVNPNHPSGKYTKEILTQTISRDINYKDASGKSESQIAADINSGAIKNYDDVTVDNPTNSQSVTFIGSGFIDEATGDLVKVRTDKNGNPIDTDGNLLTYDAKSDKVVEAEEQSGQIVAKKDANGNEIESSYVVLTDKDGNVEKGSLTWVPSGKTAMDEVNASEPNGHYAGYKAVTGHDSVPAESIDLNTHVNVSGIKDARGKAISNPILAQVLADTDYLESHVTTGADGKTKVAQAINLNPGYILYQASSDLGSDIVPVTITQDITRKVEYKDNKDGLKISDPNGTDRNTVKGLDPMNTNDQNQLIGNTTGEQKITITGTAYYDNTTHKFVKVEVLNGHIYAVDKQGNPVTSSTDKDDYAQGGFYWTINANQAAGWDTPEGHDATGKFTYTKSTDKVPALLVSKVDTSKFSSEYLNEIETTEGKSTDQLTVGDVIDFWNKQSDKAAKETAISGDVITDPTNYPKMSKIVRSDQYIFDQYQLYDTGRSGKEKNPVDLVVTLAVKRSDPSGDIYAYVTNKDYSQVYWESGENALKSLPSGSSTNLSDDPNYSYTDPSNAHNYRIMIYNFNGDLGNSVSTYVVSPNWENEFTLKRIFGYGAQPKEDTLAQSWGDYKPSEVTQTIHYEDEQGNEIKGFPTVKVTGLTGQHFDASGVNPLTIAGYTPDPANSHQNSGSISDYQVGTTYTRTWVTDEGHVVKEAHTLINSDGTMSSKVWIDGQAKQFRVKNQLTDEGIIKPKGYIDVAYDNNPDHDFSIQNPWVPSTSDITLKYQKQGLASNQDPFYVVYTPTARQDDQALLKIVDEDEGNKELDRFTDHDQQGQNITFTKNTVDGKNYEGLQSWVDQGYVFVSATNDANGDSIGSITVDANNHITQNTINFGKYLNKNQSFTIVLRHGTKPVNPNHPSDKYTETDLTKDVTRTIHYVESADKNKHLAPDVEQTLHFEGSGYVDAVTGDLVAINKDGSIDKTKKGELTWTFKGGSADAGSFEAVISPNIDGYTIHGVDKNSTDNKNVDAATVTHNSVNYDVTVTYAKKPNVPPKPDQETLTVKYYDDTVGKDKQDLSPYNKTITGAANSDLNYTTQGSITELENKGFKLVSDSFTAANLNGKMPVHGGSYEVHFIHKTTTVTPDKPGDPKNPLNPHDPNSPKYPADTTKQYLEKHGTQTVHYVIGGNEAHKPQAPADNVQTISFTKSKVIDNVTGKVIDEGHWNIERQSYPAITSPVVPGYQPNAKVVGGETVNVTDDHLDKNYIVTYTPNGSPIDNTQIARVIYQDQDTKDASGNDTVLARSNDLKGQPGEIIKYSTHDEIQHFEDLGYVLINDGFPTDAAYDNNPATPQVFYVTFGHGHRPVNPNNPGKPDQPINPGPNSPKYPKGTDTKSLTKTITRTIHYEGAGANTPKDVTQSVTFTESGTLDKVTGKWILSDGTETDDISKGLTWSADQSVANVISPTIIGYQVISVNKDSTDGKNVDSKTLTHTGSSYQVTVTYGKRDNPATDKQNAEIHYIDADNQNQDITNVPGVTTGKVSGDPNTQIVYSTKDSITKLENAGYVLVNDGFPTDAVYDDDDNSTQKYYVVFKHGHQPVKPGEPGKPGQPINPNDPNNPNGPKYPQGSDQVTETFTRTIHYTGAGDQTPKDVVQTIHFTGYGTLDKVTGKWILDDGSETDDINKGMTWSADQTLSSQATPFIQYYHVVSVSADSKDGINVDAKTISHQDDQETVTVTYAPNGHIIPVDPNGKQIPGVDHPQYPTDPTNPKNVTPNEPVPNIPGMNPKTPTVTPKDPGKDTNVPYVTPSADQGTVNVYVHDNTTGDNIPSYNWTTDVNGKPQNVGTKVSYDKTKTITDLENHGYKVINPGVTIPGTITKGTTNVTIYVEHNLKPVNPKNPGTPGQPINPSNPNGPKWPNGTDDKSIDKTITRTIKFVDENGNTLRTPVKQSVHFIATGEIDEVTGDWTKPLTWSPDQQVSGMDPQSLIENGYHIISIDKDTNAAHNEVNAVTLKHSDPDYIVTVTYAQNGKIIPVDPNNNNQPIHDAPTPVLPTDPNDPTKVDNGEKPSVPGYKPETGNPGDPVQPAKNPSEDVKVPYIKNPDAVPANGTVTYYDQTTKTNIKVDPIKGNVGEKITYTTADQIKKLEDQGYKLVSNNFRDGQEVFTKDGNKFVVTLEHDTETINPNNPGHPGEPINPNDPNGPKWGKDTGDDSLQVIGKQIVHYTGAGKDTPKDVENDVYFNHEVVIDKVTGKVLKDNGWTVSTDKEGKNIIAHEDSHDFDPVKTPVVKDYVADKISAGKGTISHSNPEIKETVTYTPIGKIIPVDPSGTPIKNAPTPNYINDPDDPTKVIPNEPVPTINGLTPEKDHVTPTDPTKDTPVVYNNTPIPDVPTPPAGPGTVPATSTPSSKPTSPTQPTTAPEPSTPQKPDLPHVPAGPGHHHKQTHGKPSTSHSNTPKPAGYNYNNNPHGENGNWSTNNPPISETTPTGNGNGGNGNVGPNGQTLPNGDRIMPNGEVVDPNGRVVGYVDKNGQVHYTLPQTGENQQTNIAAVLAGGAAVAIGLIGLAGVKKRRV